jgi:hypothetical protein
MQRGNEKGTAIYVTKKGGLHRILADDFLVNDEKFTLLTLHVVKGAHY